MGHCYVPKSTLPEMQMHKQAVTRLSTLSLSGFLASVGQIVDADNARVIKRHMQRGMFELMWGRVHQNADVTKQMIFQTVGSLAAHLFNGGLKKPSVAFKKELSAKPMTGLIRSKVSFHNDIRFILTVVQNELCLMLDNSALDSKMSTVMTYDAVACSFVDSDEGLLDYVMEHEVAM